MAYLIIIAYSVFDAYFDYNLIFWVQNADNKILRKIYYNQEKDQLNRWTKSIDRGIVFILVVYFWGFSLSWETLLFVFRLAGVYWIVFEIALNLFRGKHFMYVNPKSSIFDRFLAVFPENWVRLLVKIIILGLLFLPLT